MNPPQNANKLIPESQNFEPLRHIERISIGLLKYFVSMGISPLASSPTALYHRGNSLEHRPLSERLFMRSGC